MEIEVHAIAARDFTNAVLETVIKEGWVVNPSDFVLLVRAKPAAHAPEVRVISPDQVSDLEK